MACDLGSVGVGSPPNPGVMLAGEDGRVEERVKGWWLKGKMERRKGRLEGGREGGWEGWKEARKGEWKGDRKGGREGREEEVWRGGRGGKVWVMFCYFFRCCVGVCCRSLSRCRACVAVCIVECVASVALHTFLCCVLVVSVQKLCGVALVKPLSRGMPM